MEKNTKTLLMALAVLLAAGALVFILTKKSGEQTDTIRIGFIGPLTGNFSQIGTSARAAVELAITEINRDGGAAGKRVEVIYEDGKCDAGAATSAAQKLINTDKVTAIIGGLCSTETAAIGPLAMQKKIITVSYCSSAPSLSGLGAYFFRSYPSDVSGARFAAEYAYNTLKARKIAAIYSINYWGTNVRGVFDTRFKELGGKILGIENIDEEPNDHQKLLTRIKGLNADYLYIDAPADTSTALLKQAKGVGIKTKILGTDKWGDATFQKEIGGLFDISYFEPRAQLAKDAQAKIEDAIHSSEVPVCVGRAYDSAKMLADVIQKVGTDPEKIREELQSGGYSGVSGQIVFDKNGDLIGASYVVKKIK